MVKLKRKKNFSRNEVRAGVVIDCDELTIAIFPPPREHGAPHCHVRAKAPRKINGREIFPELKVFLNGARVIEVISGFTSRDVQKIAGILFGSIIENDQTNVQFLSLVWKELHNDK